MSDHMHIALLSAEYPPMPGGVGDYTRCLAHAVAAQGCTVSIITSQQPNALSIEQPSHAIAEYRTVSSWRWHCWRDTIATLDEIHPDVLHIQYQTGAYAMHPAINALPWRLRGVRGVSQRPHVVVTFHDVREPYLFPKAGRLRRWVTHCLARDADHVIVTNDADAVALSFAAPSVIPIGSNIAVAPPPHYERTAWRTSFGIAPHDIVVAYFGLLSRSKGVDVLLDAFEIVQTQQQHNSIPTMWLLLIGGAATTPHDRAFAAEMDVTIAQHPYRAHIIRTGHVDVATVSAHLLAADCVALPFHEGASLRSGSLLAALSHGTPVVTTHSLAIAPHLHHNTHALLVPPHDSHALAHALHQIAHDTNLRQHLAHGAHAVGQQFQWHDIARHHCTRYSAVIAQ